MFQGCKAKKLPQKPAEPVAASTPPPTAPKPAPKPPVVQAETPAPVQNTDYNFSNIQFEFDSSVLKTAAYPELDKMAAAMKMSPSKTFDLNGYASIEGTPEHNMVLSQDRANSVKTYLVNSGVSSASIITKGFGTADPIGDNTTEDGRVLNRRVEIRIQQ